MYAVEYLRKKKQTTITDIIFCTVGGVIREMPSPLVFFKGDKPIEQNKIRNEQNLRARICTRPRVYAVFYFDSIIEFSTLA